MIKSGIYKIYNNRSDKVYIGSTICFSRRKRDHFYELKLGTHHCKGLQNAYNKYKADSFSFEIIELCDKSNLISREQYYLDSTKLLYNSSKTAGSCLGYKFGKQSEQTRRKKSDNSTRKRKVDCFNLDSEFIKRYNSLTEATKETRVSQIHIREICIGKRYSRNGFRFKYLEQEELFKYPINNNCAKNKTTEKINKIHD